MRLRNAHGVTVTVADGDPVTIARLILGRFRPVEDDGEAVAADAVEVVEFTPTSYPKGRRRRGVTRDAVAPTPVEVPEVEAPAVDPNQLSLIEE